MKVAIQINAPDYYGKPFQAEKEIGWGLDFLPRKGDQFDDLDELALWNPNEARTIDFTFYTWTVDKTIYNVRNDNAVICLKGEDRRSIH